MVYTFNLLKQNKVLDINAVWSVLSSVTQQGSDQVVMTFKAPAVTYFYYIADQIGIVSQKVWSKIANPAKFPDTNPIGTGPYMVSAKTCSPQNISYHANPHYWQPGKPKIATVNYPAFLTNDTANTFLANGQAQWGSQFIPSITKFLAGQPAIKWWFPPVANVSVFINLTDPVLKNVAVRQAMAYAINRQKASTLGEFGYEPASNQTGIVTPTFSKWLDTSQAAAFGNNYAYNPAKAISILQKAGFKKGSDGIFAKGGQKLSFTIVNNGGFSDWVNAVNVIIADLKAVGIQVTAQNLSATSYQAKVYAGQYQLAYNSETGGPSPYFELRQWLYSANSAPIGTAAGSNFERYSNKATDALINRVSADDRPGAAAADREQARAGHAAGRPGHPDHRVGRLVPVRHQQVHRLAHAVQPVRAACRVQLPGLGPGDAEPDPEGVTASAGFARGLSAARETGPPKCLAGPSRKPARERPWDRRDRT